MDCVNQFNIFLNTISNDPRIGASHVSLYVTLYRQWINNQCIDPVRIRRNEVMKTARISGIATYHKCMKELNEYGYIKYVPSYHPTPNTKVYLNYFYNDETRKNSR